MPLKNYELYDRDGKIFVRQQIEVPEIRYDRARREEFAALDGEGMDSMRKALVALTAGQPVPGEFAEYISKIEAVKAKYPKPKEGTPK